MRLVAGLSCYTGRKGRGGGRKRFWGRGRMAGRGEMGSCVVGWRDADREIPSCSPIPPHSSLHFPLSLAHTVNTRQGCLPTAPQRRCGMVAVHRTAGALFTNGRLPQGGGACQLGFESRVSAISDSTVCRSQQQRLLSLWLAGAHFIPPAASLWILLFWTVLCNYCFLFSLLFFFFCLFYFRKLAAVQCCWDQTNRCVVLWLHGAQGHSTCYITCILIGSWMEIIYIIYIKNNKKLYIDGILITEVLLRLLRRLHCLHCYQLSSVASSHVQAMQLSIRRLELLSHYLPQGWSLTANLVHTVVLVFIAVPRSELAPMHWVGIEFIFSLSIFFFYSANLHPKDVS